MPFRYFGGKKSLARHYPAPEHDRIVEPFAGSAGYSLWWARPSTEVILVEKDGRVCDLWRRLQKISLDELMSIECPPLGQRCTEPLINLAAASENTMRSRRFHDSQVTARMVEKWEGSRRYIAGKLDLIRGWAIIDGDYSDAPDVEATWHIDPPYQPRIGQAAGSRGDGYSKHCNSRTIDFSALGQWARSRRGLVMVCEHVGADWLPFQPFRDARTTSSSSVVRTEALWVSDPIGNQPPLFGASGCGVPNGRA